MLLPEEVKPLLVHEDRYIRAAALDYFRESWSCDPELLPLLIRGYELYGAGKTPRPLALGNRFFLDEAAFDQVIATLATCQDKVTIGDLNRILVSASPALLVAKLPVLKGVKRVNAETMRAIERKAELAEWPADRLWQELQDFSARSEDNKYVGQIDHDNVDALVEALAMHETPAADEICRMLRSWDGDGDSDAKGDDYLRPWLEIFLIDLAGKRRLREAIPVLVDKFRVDTDYMLDRASVALARIGDVEAVRNIRGRFANEPKHFRWYAHSVFGDIKHPESEEAIFEALASEDEITIRTMLCGELCKLFSARGVEIVAEEIRGGYDDFFDKLDDRVLPIAEVLGIDLPEADEWRARRTEREQWQFARRTELADLAQMIAKNSRIAMQNRGGGLHKRGFDDDFDGSRSENDGDVAVAPLPPIRNAKVKIGRNDPCPCGSGKKFKKCCG